MAGQQPAVILATRPLGEADLLVVLLTASGGKLRAAARNARRSRRRFPSGLPGGSIGDAQLVEGRGGLWRLDGFAQARDLSPLRRDLQRFGCVAYVCELTDALVQEPEPDPRTFAALLRCLNRLLDGDDVALCLRAYELRLIDALGLLPSLDRCCVCGQPWAAEETAPVPFDARRGGLLCEEHRGAANPLHRGVIELAVLLHGEDGGADEALRRAPADVRRGLRDLTASVVREHLPRPLRSLEFFAKLPTSGA